MSVEMIDRVYGHHHPDHLRTAAQAIDFGRRVPLAEPLAARSAARQPITQVVEKSGGPGRTRTSNQTVMSAQSDHEKREKPGKSDED
jgi:hypothetical protein